MGVQLPIKICDLRRNLVSPRRPSCSCISFLPPPSLPFFNYPFLGDLEVFQHLGEIEETTASLVANVDTAMTQTAKLMGLGLGDGGSGGVRVGVRWECV